jgi:hypothetical protein
LRALIDFMVPNGAARKRTDDAVMASEMPGRSTN